MRPVRPEGGGRPPQAPKPTTPDISEILRQKEAEPLSPEQQKKKRRTLLLLVVLTALSLGFAVFITVKAFSALAQL